VLTLGSQDYKGSVFLDLDYTLTEERSIVLVGAKLGLDREIIRILESEKPEYIKSVEIARLLKGLRIDLIKKIVYENTVLKKGVDRFISELINEGYSINIVTLTYKQIAEMVLLKISEVLDKDLSSIKIYAPILETDLDNVVTGRLIFDVSNQRLKTPFCIECSLCKRFIVKKFRMGKVVSIGDARPDACMFLESDRSIVIKSPSNRYIVSLNADLVIEDFSDLESIMRFIKEKS